MKIYNKKARTPITKQHFQFDPSFGPYVLFLKQKMEESSVTVAKFYRYLIKKFQQHPLLLIPFKNVNVLEEHAELIELLQMSLSPLSHNSEDLPMALAFMQPDCLFYFTPSFKKNFIDQHITFDTKEDEITTLQYFIKLVLKRCYNIETLDTHKNIKQVKNQNGDTVNYYQLNAESRFIQVHLNGTLPPFENHWVEILNSNDDKFLELFQHFPSHNFRLEGFCMFSIEDVSKEMAINKLRNAILNIHIVEVEETLDQVERAIGELLNDPKIKIAITPFYKINGKVVFNKSFFTKGICISSVDKRVISGSRIEDIYDSLQNDAQPYIFSSFDKEFVMSRSSLSDLAKHDIKNFLFYPITTVRDGLMGVFELEKGHITSNTIDILQPAFPLITDLIYHMIELFDNKINKLVKEKFTPLLPSVEWKFNEVAWEYLKNEGKKNADETMGNVIFKEVHPIYGAVDIRDSSTERNIALKNDYINQLKATLELLQKTSQKVSLPLLDSIRFKGEKFINSITDLLTSETELKINQFLQQDVIVFFKYLSSHFPEYLHEVDDYFKKMDKQNGEFHRNLNSYETTVQKITNSLIAYFDLEVERQQSIYPFYYEKYRTDGVEYNIYVGQSIVPTHPFDPIYLKNLRLWQVASMANIARSNFEMLSTLPIPLRTTQLILVNEYPIDISFRKDERRFDVEGSYNIRYEILKKRIDKARIKSSLERLTQPDKIAIVYSNYSEIEEYIQHINFLQSKDVLTDTMETLELENLQGVSGLKALRVGVNYE